MTTEKTENSFTLPSSQTDRKKIKDALYEMSAQFQMIDDRKAAVKDIVDSLHEEFQIPKKIINQLAKTLYKHNYADVSHESTLFEIVYEGLLTDNA